MRNSPPHDDDDDDDDDAPPPLLPLAAGRPPLAVTNEIGTRRRKKLADVLAKVANVARRTRNRRK